MEATRTQLADGMYLTYLPAEKFKTSLLSAQFVTPLSQERVQHVRCGGRLPPLMHCSRRCCGGVPSAARIWAR